MRKLGVLLVAGVLLFSAASCTTKTAEDVSAGSPSTEASNNDNGETSTTRRSTTTTVSESDAGDTDVSDIPALGDLGDCLEVSLTYAGLFLGAAFATDEQRAELEQQLDEIKGKVPADIQDDMDVISQGMADADGIVGLGEFLDSDEFKEADANIQQYFEDSCGSDSGSSGN